MHDRADVVRSHTCAVRIKSLFLRAPASAERNRARFVLPRGALAFATFADAYSSLSRKNSPGTLLIYLQAFPEATAGTFLSTRVVAPEIRICTQDLSSEESATLFASVDVVVSLHRGQGFGLTIAEGYLAYKPVIVTGWSGNLGYVEPETRGILAPTELDCRQGLARQCSDGGWTEPDLHATSSV